MEIVISSEGQTLESHPSLRFGRAPYFIKFDLEKETWEAIQNPAIDQSGGAGIKAAQTIIDQNISNVLSGRFGPNAHRALTAAGIKLTVFNGNYHSINEIIDAFKKNELNEQE